MRGHDEVGLDAVLLEEGVPLVAEARLHLVVSVQALQGGPGDVHLAGGGSRALNARPAISPLPTLHRPPGSAPPQRKLDSNHSFNLAAASKIVFLCWKQDGVEPGGDLISGLFKCKSARYCM